MTARASRFFATRLRGAFGLSFDFFGAALFTAIGAALAVYRFGASRIATTGISAVPTGDFGMGLLGWIFYRADAWRFPLGVTQSYFYPIGASVGNTDSIPWFALFFKLLSPILPDTFQYFGLWVMLCYALQGWMGYRLSALLFRDRVLRLLGAGFFLFSAPWFYRGGHLALSAHWVLLACICFAIRYARGELSVRQMRGRFLALNAFCAGVHPYLLMMTLSLTACWAALHATKERPRGRAMLCWCREILPQASAAVLLLWMFGYFWFKGTTDEGFGYYGADLLTLFNAMDGASRFLPSIRATGGQYEGMAYIGLGGLLLLPIAIWGTRTTGLFEKGNRPNIRWIGMWCVLLAIYALSSQIRFGGNRIVNLEVLYRLLGPIPGSFRASGRFIWPLFYILMASGLVVVVRRLGIVRARGVLAVCLAAQIADLSPLWSANPLSWGGAVTLPEVFTESGAHALRGGVLETLPPVLVADLRECNPAREEWNQSEANRLFLLAGLRGMRVNAGAVSRGPVDRIRAYCTGAWRVARARQWTPGSLYLLTAASVAHLGWKTLPSECWRGGSYVACRGE